MLAALLFIGAGSYAQKTTSAFGERMRMMSKKAPSGHIRCVTNEYEAELQEKYPNRPTRAEFEAWLAKKIDEEKVNRRGTTASPAIVVTIPVVVHVIHNGDALGVNENITDAQVISQITVLNQDYRKMLGTPGYNSNTVGADVEIEFCLAQRTPDGQATNGIEHINLGVASWNESQVEGTLKPQTQWDPTQYFNIWVCNFGGDLADVLGYAQFPSTSGLGGMAANGGDADTDGVIIGYKYFGSSTLYPSGNYEAPYDQGRTATHEIGHCFGLIHIWGDNSSCTVNATDSNKDYCPDTPAASTEHYGCTADNSCTAAAGNDMIENYMDYSDDACMNIFTQNQKTRILTVLQNSIRRATLVTSSGCTPVQTYGLDGKLDIVDLNVDCGTSFSPAVTLTNKGLTALSTATITYNIDGTNPQTYSWSGMLLEGESETINLNPISATAGTHVFNSAVTNINGSADENTANDSSSQTFTIAESYATTNVLLTLQRDQYGSETTWLFTNSAGTVLYSGGPYTDTNTLPAVLTQTFTVTSGECYTFTINDEYGDGICCTYGNGYYNLKTADNTIIVSGTNFGSTAAKTFGVSTLGLDDVNSNLNQIVLYPNPVQETLNIGIQNESALPDTFTIYNSIGQLIQTVKVNSVTSLNVNTSALSSGVYFVKITKDNASRTLRFVKN